MTDRWLITGAAGMLGSVLTAQLSGRSEEVVALSRSDLDITDQRAVERAVHDARPKIIVNCAAFTRVDAAEEQESVATAINGSAVEVLASAANRAGAVLVQISTDFVFDGTKRSPYEITDRTNPISAYGRSKLVGEHAAQMADRHVIVRTSWVFGPNGPNFVDAIRRQLVSGNRSLRVVDDQRGRPTYTGHLSRAVIRLARLAVQSSDAYGTFHYADQGDVTWFDFARAIAEEAGSGAEIVPVATVEFPRPAPRPAYSVLSTERYERTTGVIPEQWRDGLAEYLQIG